MVTVTSSSRPRSGLYTLLVLVSCAIFLLQTAHAYEVLEPTATTTWSAGQQVVVKISSDKRAPAMQNPNLDRFVVTLERGIPYLSEQMAVLSATMQLLIPFDAPIAVTEVVRDIPWTVPPLPLGQDYFINIEFETGLFKDKASKQFAIVAAPSVTTTATPTSTPTPTPTQPAGPTCEDIKQQCAAQARVYNPPAGTQACACGDLLPQPKLPISTGVALAPLPHKTSSGAVPALVVLVMALVGMF
ncbi:hypothetical protein BGZ73_003857 [Actinomortierella ambigua]|nr:hypothetical protein BGZ73_003857 [Actinomortierella ambigua]